MCLGQAESTGCRVPGEAQSAADCSYSAQGAVGRRLLTSGPRSRWLSRVHPKRSRLTKGRMGAPSPRSLEAILGDPHVSKLSHLADLSDA